MERAFKIHKTYTDHINRMIKLYMTQWNLIGLMLMRPFIQSEAKTLRNYLNVLKKRVDHFAGVHYRNHGD